MCVRASPKHNLCVCVDCFTEHFLDSGCLLGYESSAFFSTFVFLETNKTCDSALNYTPSFAAPMCKHSYEKLVQLTFNKTRKKVRYIRR